MASHPVLDLALFRTVSRPLIAIVAERDLDDAIAIAARASVIVVCLTVHRP